MLPAMSDRHTNGQPTGNDGQPTVTVAEAAHVLGITPDSVRSRLQRGTLPGEKIAGIWHVTLPQGIGIKNNNVKLDPGVEDIRQAPTGNATGTDGQLQDALIEQLRSENLYLRERLEEADRQQAQMLGQLAEERQRADVLQLRAIGTGETSPNTPSEAPGSSESDDQPLQGVRAWWKRWWSS